MTFQEPMLLWLLLLLVPLVIFARLLRARREKKLARFIDRANWGLLNPEVNKHTRAWKAILVFLALALSVTAAARPLWGTRERPVMDRAIDVAVVFDVSRSMLASDVAPSRLEHARIKTRELMLGFPGHRMALVPFAGEALLMVPLTTDYSILNGLLNRMDTSTIGFQGTDIAAGIDTARRALNSGGGGGTKVIVLITDGEDHEGRAIEEARKAADEGIIIHAIGIGSEEGTTLRINDTIVTDREGRPVLTRLDVETLDAITSITGGRAWISGPGQSIDTRPLIAELNRLERGEFADRGVQSLIREERFQWPLGIALALLFVEGLLGERRRARRGKEAVA